MIGQKRKERYFYFIDAGLHIAQKDATFKKTYPWKVYCRSKLKNVSKKKMLILTFFEIHNLFL